jgi:WS/DGAT/MGAT family acyltransferase
MALDPIKAMGRAVNGKVNDVLLALAAGALRRWLEARGTPLEAGEALRATVPINLRPMDQVVELGNRIGMVFVHLPVAVRGVRARLDAVKAEMDAIKGSAEAPVTFGLMRALGFTSPEVEDALLDVFSRKASLVLSNVPGPSARLRFAGQPLRRLMFWVPQSGSISLGLSIISYAGEVMLGACADRGLFPDLGELSEAVHAEHDHMAEVLGA